jgi:hypothetical protein
MAITINTPIIHKSYASVLSRIDPNALIFDNPNQQGTKLPAWFIVHREPVSSTCAIDGYQWVVYAIDIYYMVEYNKPRLFDEYAAIADQLDLELEYLPIYGTDAVVHVFDRSWELAMNALKYSTTLRLRVHPSVQREPLMQVIQDLSVFLKLQFEAILTFENTTHPEFDAQIPNPISVTTGQSVNLPFVGGEFEDDDYKWTPSGWSIGAFGARIRLDESITTNLLWSSTEKTASLSFTNTTHPEFDVQLPQTITENKGTSITLPSVTGRFPDGPIDWIPSSWSIGSFDSSFILDTDTSTDLAWRNETVIFTISFTNSNHPEFEVELPQPEQLARGNSILLPTVTGSFIADGYEWTPDSWDIGSFGDSYTPNNDVIANLLWKSQEYGPVLPTTEISRCWLAQNKASRSVPTSFNIIPYDANNNYIPYSSSLLYCIVLVSSIPSTLDGTFEIGSSINGYLLIQRANGTNSGTIYSIDYATCSDKTATVIDVYDSNNVAYKAFKYTLDGVDYYRVLNWQNTYPDWTDDLESIGYSLNPLFEEFTLYCERSVLNYRPNITSSSVITASSTAYRRQLFLDSSRTTPFTFDTSKRYVKGRYVSGVWTPDPVQSIADMPSTTTSDIGASVTALIIVGVNGTTIGVNGNAWILAITNYTGNNATTPASPCYVRVYDSEQQQYQTGWMTSNKSATTLSGDNYLYGSDGFKISASSSNTYTIVALYSSESGAPFTDSSLYLLVVGGYLNIVDPNYRSYTIQRVEYTIT